MTEPTSRPPAVSPETSLPRAAVPAAAGSAPAAEPQDTRQGALTAQEDRGDAAGDVACPDDGRAGLPAGAGKPPEQTAAQQEAARVAAYLTAHPDFLARQPALYASMAPPRRVHGAIFADHMDAMLRQARSREAAQEANATAVLAAGRAAAAIAERVQEAVLAALAASDPVDFVSETLPGLLGVDAASLACEAARPRWRRLPPGLVRGLLRNRPVVFRDRPADAALLHAEAALLAERDILVALPGETPALLALVSRDATALPAQQGTQALAFLGRVLATLLHT